MPFKWACASHLFSDTEPSSERDYAKGFPINQFKQLVDGTSNSCVLSEDEMHLSRESRGNTNILRHRAIKQTLPNRSNPTGAIPANIRYRAMLPDELAVTYFTCVRCSAPPAPYTCVCAPFKYTSINTPSSYNNLPHNVIKCSLLLIYPGVRANLFAFRCLRPIHTHTHSHKSTHTHMYHESTHTYINLTLCDARTLLNYSVAEHSLGIYVSCTCRLIPIVVAIF